MQSSKSVDGSKDFGTNGATKFPIDYSPPAIQVIWKPKSDQNVILDAYMTTAPFGSAKKTALSKETTKKHYRDQCRIERC